MESHGCIESVYAAKGTVNVVSAVHNRVHVYVHYLLLYLVCGFCIPLEEIQIWHVHVFQQNLLY